MISSSPETRALNSSEPSGWNSSCCVLCQSTSATFCATSGLKRIDDLVVRPVAGDQVPGVAQVAFEAEAAGNAELESSASRATRSG